MTNKSKLIESILCKSLRNLWSNNGEIIRRNVKEECINHQLGKILELYIRESNLKENLLNIDLEYDKNYNNPKSYICDGKVIKFRPDIIVHQRNSNKNNLIAFELKKNYPNKKDFMTLSNLRNKPYEYQFCFAISYLPKAKYFKIYLVQSAKKIFVSKLLKSGTNQDFILNWTEK